MALSQKLLSQDEIVVRHMHTHIKKLLPAIIVESILVIAAAVGSFYVPENARYWADIQIEKDFDDRIFGCGTLALQTSADDPLLLRDVPKVETVQVEISNLIFNDVQGAIDADPTS